MLFKAGRMDGCQQLGLRLDVRISLGVWDGKYMKRAGRYMRGILARKGFTGSFCICRCKYCTAMIYSSLAELSNVEKLCIEIAPQFQAIMIPFKRPR